MYQVPGRELTHLQLLPAYVEIMVAGKRPGRGRPGLHRARGIAAQHQAPALHARAALARGAVHLAAGNPDRALPALRQAHGLWQT